jgi:hypothetical protein
MPTVQNCFDADVISDEIMTNHNQARKTEASLKGRAEWAELFLANPHSPCVDSMTSILISPRSATPAAQASVSRRLKPPPQIVAEMSLLRSRFKEGWV